MKYWFVCLVFCICNVFAAPLKVPRPSVDEFYYGPEGYEDQPLGTILRWRKTPAKLRSVYFPIDVKNSWDILVRSEDSHGNATAVVSTIIEPYNADPKKLVAFSIAQDASGFDCSPTYAIVDGARTFDNLEAEFEFALYAGAALLSQGYYVVTTSYETTAEYKSAFTAGRLAGTNILNSLEATLNTGNFTGLDDPEVILWGYSGGALATIWTAALMKEYKPDLAKNVIGATAGGLPSNITTTVVATDNTIFAGLVANGVNGLMNEYPEISDVVKNDMIKQNFADFHLSNELCLVPSLLHYPDTNFFQGNDSYFKNGYDVLTNSKVKAALLDNTLAVKNNSEIPEIPLFLYHGIWDQIVPHINSQRVYDNWCASGAKSIEFATDLTMGHITGFAVGIPAASAWIKNRFDGIPPVSGCNATEYLTLLEYPGTSPELTSVVESFATEFFGEKVGPANVTKREIADLHSMGLLEDDFLMRKMFARGI